MPMTLRPGRWLLAGAALTVSIMALGYVVNTPGEHGFREQGEAYRAHWPWLLAHVIGGALALAGGALQLLLATRCAVPGLAHRWTGVLYVLAVLVSGIAGLRLAGLAWGGVSNTAAFSLLASAWMLSTVLAARAAWRGDGAAHALWISRSCALTFAAVTLRVETAALLALGLSFDEAYFIVPWTSWVLNLLAVEWSRSWTTAAASGCKTGLPGETYPMP
jgi:hypothetical protein